MAKSLRLNPGSQKEFVENEFRYSAFIGGVGSGKTFAGLARGLKFSQQPKIGFHGPRGAVVAETYRHLKDVVLPEFFQMVEGTGLLPGGEDDSGWSKSQLRARLSNGAEILFRSLEQPNRLRGLQLSWFFIDEGRLVNKTAWDVLIGRLRQPGYEHSGWVSSTANGYDWMWETFVGPDKHPDGYWFSAPTTENASNLDPDYIRDLKASYAGPFYEQEVLGKFVGVIAGAVFPHFDLEAHVGELIYDPTLPLYSFWDFGVGDLGVVQFAQIAHVEKELDDGTKVFIPQLRYIGEIEHKDWGAKEWAYAWKAWLETNVGGRQPNLNIGDPAGRQRSQASGTSVLDALAAEGVIVQPAPKRAPDHGILILDNMMVGDRVFVGKQCPRTAAAFATHKWNTDDNGNRIGTQPVHDWTSHYASASRYGAASLLSHFPKRSAKPANEPPPPGTLGHILEQLNRQRRNQRDLLGWDNDIPNIDWQPHILVAN